MIDYDNKSDMCLMEIVGRRWRDLQALNPKHKLLDSFCVYDFGLGNANSRVDREYNFELISRLRSLGIAIREELEKKLGEHGLLEMVRNYF